MEIFGICIIGILAAVMALLLRRQSPQTALLLSVGAGTLMILSVIKNILLTTQSISQLLQSSGINADYIVILFKVLGICFLTEFTCDTVTEAGMLSLATNISFAGKVTVLITVLPMFRDIIAAIASMVSAS
ncbi:MAG: hypothetical protein IJ639_06515 [Ruminococcus sp.]|nr:hypothetical protein [Ruminococcus sp.]